MVLTQNKIVCIPQILVFYGFTAKQILIGYKNELE